MVKEITLLDLFIAIKEVSAKIDIVDVCTNETGRVAQETQRLVQELLASRDDQEYRISSLERGQARLRILVER